MQFSITITGEDKELTPAVQALVTALAEGNAYVTVGKPNAEPEKPKRGNKAKPEPEKQPEPKPEDEDNTSEPDPEAAEDDSTTEVPTVVELRAKAQEVGTDPKKKPKIKAILNEFEVQNITSVPEDRRVEFMARLESL